MKMNKPISFAFLLWLLIADLASAGDYRLVIGKGIEVCEAYLKNLNLFPKHPPMVCDRPLNPSLKELRKPEWRPVDILQNLDLLRHVEQTLRRMTDAQWEQQKEQWASKVKERVAKGWLSMSTTDLDVDRDGTLERVLRYVNDTPPKCDPKNESFYAGPGGSPFHFVLTPDQRQIDLKKTELTFPIAGGRPDLFLFKGQVYATSWAGNLGFQDGTLYVDTPSVTKPVPMPALRPCHYKYVGSPNRRQP